MDSTLRFTLNDGPVEVRDLPSTTTLLEWLRRERGLTGTKEGCAEGDCGACTVAVLDRGPDGPTFRAIDSCLLLLPMLHGRRVFTVEGLVRNGVPHPVQDAMTRHLGSQCGYCTPGFVMSLFEATYRGDLDRPWKLDDQICGNLCRCTGYRPIRDALHEVAGAAPDDPFRRLLAEPVADRTSLAYEGEDGRRFFLPASWDELWDVLDREEAPRFVSGATDLGLDVTKKRRRFSCLVSTAGLPGLTEVLETPEGFSIGAGLPLSDLERWAEEPLPPLARMLRFFGSRQIKHGATLGGNLANASPIGDTPPVLLALGAAVVLRSRAGERRVALEDFFLDYRKPDVRPGEVIARVEVPKIPAGARVAAYKVSKRRELDISAVAAGMFVRVGSDGVVAEARIGFGGLAATPKRAAHAERALAGHAWNEANVARAAGELARDFTPIDDHRGSAWYRGTVARNLLLGFFEETRRDATPRLPDRPSATVVLEASP